MRWNDPDQLRRPLLELGAEHLTIDTLNQPLSSTESEILKLGSCRMAQEEEPMQVRVISIYV